MKKILLALLVSVGLLVFASTSVNAQEAVPDGVFLQAGENLVIDDQIKGDAYVAGGQVRFSGEIEGDLNVFGGQVIVDGPVKGSVKVVGGEVEINSQVEGGVAVVGGKLKISTKATIAGYVLAAGGVIGLEGAVNGDVWMAGGEVYLNGKILTNGVIAGAKIAVGPEAVVSGKMTFVAPKEAVGIDGRAIFASGYEITEAKTTQSGIREQAKAEIGGSVLGLVMYFIFGLVVFWGIKEKGVTTIMNLGEKNWKATIFTGFIWFVLIVPVFFVLLMTIVGVPLAVVWLLVSALGLIFSRFWAAVLVGKKVLDGKGYDVRSFTLGLVALTALELVPYMGMVVKILVWSLGLGIALRAVKPKKTK